MDDTAVNVSYIISTRNRADFLDKALANVQEYITPADELIVVDGASTDHTAEVIGKHRDIVTRFICEPDCGEAHGYNKGILVSRGRYIKPISDDDYFYPEAMRKAVAVMQEHPELDAIVCGGEAYAWDASGGSCALQAFLWLPADRKLTADVKHLFDYVSCGLGLLFRKTIVSRVGLLDTTYRAVDTDYMGRLIAGRAHFRYLHIKLFRHVAFPHSGQQRWDECARDRVRVLLCHGDWGEALDNEAYAPALVAAALRLPADRFGASVLPIMRLVQWMERGWRPFRLAVTAASGLAAALLRWRSASRYRSSLNRGAEPQARTCEPEWDGSLR